jgi:aryl-alcohol dehydrogenase-like predicted oxidoreductase
MISQRSFGTLDFKVSIIGFGGASISGDGGGYGFGSISDEESLALIRSSVESGINLYDTAPVYGFRKSEQMIGKAFSGIRDKLFIVSKGGITWDDRKRIHIDNNPKTLQNMLERSLKDLHTEYIDLYMIHWPDRNIDIRKPMEYLSRAKDDGQIRAIGLCNTSDDEIKKAVEINRIDALQAECHLFNPLPFESLRSTLKEQKMGFMSWGTLDKGILTGRVTPGRTFEPVDARSWAPWWKHEDRTPKYKAMERINKLLAENNHSGLELALGYVLQFSELSTALCGIRNTAQLTSAIHALKHLPETSILEEARSIAEEELTTD